MCECNHNGAYESCPDEGEGSTWYCPDCESIIEWENEGGSTPQENMQEELVRWMTEGTNPDMSPRSDCG